MGLNKERDALKRSYPSKGWAKAVDKMRDDQVTAIYLKLKAKGTLK